MPGEQHSGNGAYDAVIVGGSLAGSATAILLARGGARVALVEQRPDASAYKVICSHYIQSSAIPTLERLGLVEPMTQAGALRSRVRIHVPWGWVEPAAGSRVPSGINLRRQVLDPLIRRVAAETPGVELMPGHTVTELMHREGAVSGALARTSGGRTVKLRSRLLVGADGRGSRVAKLAGVRERRVRHRRIAYGGYFEQARPAGWPDMSLWLLDPDMVFAAPTDGGLTFYAAMPTKERTEEFRREPAQALVRFVSGVPDAPPIAAGRLTQPVQGKLDMTNVAHRPAAPGLALVGDAALAIDPLWGVGCGWALQSAEWLSDSVLPALLDAKPLDAGLRRYGRRHARHLRGHAAMMYDYAGGRRFNAVERLLFSAATYDAGVARIMEAFGTRNIGPARMVLSASPRAALAAVGHAIAGRSGQARGSASAWPAR